jgi:hypothetical protein
LEPFIWSLVFVKYYGFQNNILKKIYLNIGLIQSIIILVPIFYGILNLTPGSFSNNYRNKVMKNTADGFELFEWSNSVIKDEDVLLSTHRSFSLSNNKTIPGDFLLYVNLKEKDSYNYLEEIKKIKPNVILFYGDKKHFSILKGCIGNLLHFKKNVGSRASRNPLNKQKKKYDGYIYEFYYNKLPNCIYRD